MPLKGQYAARIPNVTNAYLQENFAATADLYLAFYLRLEALPTSDVRIALLLNSGTSVGSIVLRPTGALRLRNGTTTIGQDSVPLQVGQLYRVGLRQKQGAGTDAILEGYLSSGDTAFGTPFAATTAGSWTTPSDRLRLGPTTPGTVDVTVDDIKLDSAAMPLP